MYKNWITICEIMDTHFMWAMALLDINTDFGYVVVERFPEYFSDEEVQGPVPLSVLRVLAEKDGKEQGGTNLDCLVSFDKYWSSEFSIPIFSFSTSEDSDFDDPMLPDEIDGQIDKSGRRAEVGDVFSWKGKKLVLLENNDGERGDCFLMFFAPFESVVIDK